MLYVYDCFACIYVWTTCVQCPQRLEEGSSSGTELKKRVVGFHMGSARSSSTAEAPSILIYFYNISIIKESILLL